MQCRVDDSGEGVLPQSCSEAAQDWYPDLGSYPQNRGPEPEQYIGGLNDSHNDLGLFTPQKGVPGGAKIGVFGPLFETSYWGVQWRFKRLS